MSIVGVIIGVVGLGAALVLFVRSEIKRGCPGNEVV